MPSRGPPKLAAGTKPSTLTCGRPLSSINFACSRVKTARSWSYVPAYHSLRSSSFSSSFNLFSTSHLVHVEGGDGEAGKDADAHDPFLVVLEVRRPLRREQPLTLSCRLTAIIRRAARRRRQKRKRPVVAAAAAAVFAAALVEAVVLASFSIAGAGCGEQANRRRPSAQHLGDRKTLALRLRRPHEGSWPTRPHCRRRRPQ